MLKDITTLKIKGGNFEETTPLDFFKDNKNNGKTIKSTLIYGRNGTGKSTIAKAFRKLSGDKKVSNIEVSAVDNQQNPVILSEDEKSKIFVFDEDYVERNVKIQNDHLDSIVMLGDAADLTNQLETAEKECEDTYNKYFQCKKDLNKYQDCTNYISPEYYLEKMKEVLKGDSNWAGRDKEIKGNRKNTNVSKDTYKQFISLKLSRSKDELKKEYDSKIRELKNIKNSNTIDEEVPSFYNDFISYDDEVISLLLSKKIEEPELSEREKKLFELVDEGKAKELSNRIYDLKLKKITECPYCFQPLSLEYKESLIASIEKVLNKAVEEHQKELDKHVYNDELPNVEEVFRPFEKLPSCSECIKLAKEISSSIQNNNKLLEKKRGNPYKPIILEKSSNVKNLAEQLQNALDKLNSERNNYNKIEKRIEEMINYLTNVNSEIAYYEIKDLYANYKKFDKEFKSVKKECEDLSRDYNERKKKIDDLEAKRRNFKLAVNVINACFAYIFFDKDRLRIEYSNGFYKLLSHGKSVKPCDVSVGERNIIGLTYFFTSIFRDRDEKEAYKDEYILVIDDPISSYDTENKIGIFSFLRYRLSAFLEGNEDTKAVIMTHDLMSVYDIDKCLKSIFKKLNNKKFDFNLFELKNNELETFKPGSREEYSEMLKVVYDYALQNDHDHEMVIGNLMRQVLEAFSTFEYKAGLKDLSNNNELLSIIPSEYRDYYKNLMYRLVLDGGSHQEEKVKTIQDFKFFEMISENEKRQTAKQILCLIYLLNSNHLLIHLSHVEKKDKKEIENNIKSWCEEIKEVAKSMSTATK